MHRALLLTLNSELALLLVARGESETLTVLLLLGPDLTLYIDDAGMLVINGRRFPGIVVLRVMEIRTICLIAISKDFFDSVLPKPALSGEEDLADKLLLGSIDEERTIGAPGLPLVAEGGLSDIEVLKLGGASSEKPGISEGFQGLGLTVGELARGGAGFLAAVLDDLVMEEDGDLAGGADVCIAVEVTGRRVGVDALEVDFDPGIDGLVVGVKGLAVDLELGVEDLGGTVDLVEGSVAREVGVEDLDGLDVVKVGVALDAPAVDIPLDAVFGVGLATEVDLDVLNVGRPVGVEGLDPPADEGLRRPELEVFPGDEAGCLDIKLLLAVGSGGLASYIHKNEL
nr:ATP binding protein [Ipomoea batatas]